MEMRGQYLVLTKKALKKSKIKVLKNVKKEGKIKAIRTENDAENGLHCLE